MVWRVKTKLDDKSLISRAHIRKERTDYHKLSSDHLTNAIAHMDP